MSTCATRRIIWSMCLNDSPTAKVLFRVPDDDGGANVETLWAVPLGEDRYQLASSLIPGVKG